MYEKDDFGSLFPLKYSRTPQGVAPGELEPSQMYMLAKVNESCRANVKKQHENADRVCVNVISCE